MNDKLYEWLKTHWRYNNHPKYLKYFDDWVENITENQIIHFNRMMIDGDIYQKGLS